MPSFSVDDLDIDVDDFLEECSKSELQEVRDWIKDYDSDVSSPNSGLVPDGLVHSEFRGCLEVLNHSYYRLTKEDEELIIKIANKYK